MYSFILFDWDYIYFPQDLRWESSFYGAQGITTERILKRHYPACLIAFSWSWLASGQKISHDHEFTTFFYVWRLRLATYTGNYHFHVASKEVTSLYLSGSGRVFTGSGIWPKYRPGFGKKLKILTGFGIPLLPWKRESLKFGHGTRDFYSVWREIGKLLLLRPVRRALCGVFFHTTTKDIVFY